MKAFSADKIFTGYDWLEQHSVIVEDGYINDVLPTSALPSDASIENYNNCFIAPCFIDIQIYGAFGGLLAVHPTEETLHKMYDYCNSGGAKYFLPTVATNTTEAFYACIDAVRRYWQQHGKGVIGLHIEGPWLNAMKRGAHVESLIHSPGIEEVKELLEYGKGLIKMITLAPEVCSTEVIDLINSYDIIVSAGHSNATYKQATEAFDGGINAATHLFNAMSPLQHREPGLAGAIMNHTSVMSSIIPDGHHVDFAALSIAKKVMKERLFIITDAVTETKEGYYPHQLDGDKYIANGILSGSALTMMKGVKNCVEKAGIDLDESLRMASLYPAKVLRLDNQLGKIKKGYKADFVMISAALEVAH
jgi:N-acetylglucosamine-6-phosphate deacetylase